MLDFSMADDVPPLDREMVEGNLSQLAMLPLVPRGSPGSAKARLLCGEEERLAVGRSTLSADRVKERCSLSLGRGSHACLNKKDLRMGQVKGSGVPVPWTDF